MMTMPVIAILSPSLLQVFSCVCSMLNNRRIVIKRTKIKLQNPEISADKILKLLLIEKLCCLSIHNMKLV